MIAAVLNAVPAYLLLVAVVAFTLALVVVAVWLVRRTAPATREGT